MTITAEAVKQLRERTGAGMMECKKALVESNGDLDVAAENMRKAGLAKADKAALAAGATSVDAVNGLKLGSGESVDDKRRALIAKIGENLTLRRVTLVKAPTVVGSYVHTDNKKAALVAVEGGDAELARDLAMQVVASSPRYLTPADAPADLVAKEREIATEHAKNDPSNAKKPPDILTKIVEGRVRKAIDEFALTQQVFVKDGDLTIDKLLKNNKASIKAFERYEVGARIEKKTGDFAAEVMEQVKAAQKTDKTDPPTKH